MDARKLIDLLSECRTVIDALAEQAGGDDGLDDDTVSHLLGRLDAALSAACIGTERQCEHCEQTWIVHAQSTRYCPHCGHHASREIG